MNEPGMPVPPPVNLSGGDSPSYLRPPQRRSSNHQSAALLLTVGLLALIVVIGGWYVLHKSSPDSFGSLIYTSSVSLPGFYKHSFDTGATTRVSLVKNDPLTSMRTYGIGFASMAPDGSAVVETRIDSTTGIVIVVASSLESGMQTTVGSAKKGSQFMAPVIASGGTKVAYVSVIQTSNVASKKPVFSDVLTLATLSQTKPVLRSLSVIGTPLAFSPDGTRLLVAEGASTVLLPLAASSTPVNITGLPVFKNSASVSFAVRPNGLIAFVDGNHIQWGSMDWSSGVFTPAGTIPQKAYALLFNQTGDLLLISGTNAFAYHLDKTNAKQVASWPLTLAWDAIPLEWTPN